MIMIADAIKICSDLQMRSILIMNAEKIVEMHH